VQRWVLAMAIAVAALSLGAPATARPGPGSAARSQPAPDPALARLEARAAALERKAATKPKDAGVRGRAAEVLYQAGHARMLSPKLAPREKYAGALKLLRRAVALNPGHKAAQSDIDLIESIYRQMGRPVPR